jgi:hypothetical protein
MGSRRLINRHRSGEVKASIIYVLYGPVLRVLTVDTEACAPTTVSVPITIPVTATTMAVLIIFIATLEHHAQVNQLSETSHLFAYRDMHAHCPLIKLKILDRAGEAARAAGLEPLQGHGIRISFYAQIPPPGCPL